jgi:hypothetical protein
VSLANDDILKLEQAAKTPLYTALTFLSLAAAKGEFNKRLSELKQ